MLITVINIVLGLAITAGIIGFVVSSVVYLAWGKKAGFNTKLWRGIRLGGLGLFIIVLLIYIGIFFWRATGTIELPYYNQPISTY